MTERDPIYHPTLLDALEARSRGPWEEDVWRQVFVGTDPLVPNVRGARWNPPGVEALYCSVTRDTAVAEVDHLVAMQPYPIVRDRVTFQVHVRLSRVIDLTDPSDLEELGFDLEDLRGDGKDECQVVGGAVAWLGCGGLLVPSMRHEGLNLVIFVNSAGSDDYWEASEPVPHSEA